MRIPVNFFLPYTLAAFKRSLGIGCENSFEIIETGTLVKSGFPTSPKTGP